MASLSIRKLDHSVHERLRLRAAKHGVSMEEEARRILDQVLMNPGKLSDIFRTNFGAENGVDFDLNDVQKKEGHDPIKF